MPFNPHPQLIQRFHTTDDSPEPFPASPVVGGRAFSELLGGVEAEIEREVADAVEAVGEDDGGELDEGFHAVEVEDGGAVEDGDCGGVAAPFSFG